ncbi:hypothetical protein ACEPAI_9684 [Sanghuangporus weigelae]
MIRSCLQTTASNVVHNYDKAILKREATGDCMEDSSAAADPTLSGDVLACSLPRSGPREAKTPSPRAIENDALPYFEEDETDLNSSPLLQRLHDDVASSSQLRRFTSMFKSPRRPKFIPPKDAPVVRKLNGLDDTLISNKAENNAYHHAKEGHKVIIGPMPCRQFLDEFLPPPLDNMPDHRGAFNKVPTKPRCEKDIYLPLTEAMNHNHRCPGVQFCITADLSDEEGRGSLKPDIAYGDVRDIILIEEDDSDTYGQRDALQNESGNEIASESLNTPAESHFANTDLPEFELNADNEFQCTRTNDYVNARWVCNCLRGNLRSQIPRRIHNRSRELFIGAKDALGALDSAYGKCGRLHRDVSIGNIILYRFAASEPRRGLLIDWEFSTSVDDTDVATDYYRSGTWAFMSIRALSGKNFHHTQEDDMESLLYVVTYGSIRWLPHEHVPKLGQWIYEFFSSSKENDEGQDTGGVYKELQQSVSGSKFLDTFGFKSKYIRKWFRGAYGYLNTIHESEKAKGTKSEWTMKNLRELFTSVCHYLMMTEETKHDRTEHSVEDYYVEANKARRGTHTSLGRKSGNEGPVPSNQIRLYNDSVPIKRRRSEDHEEQDDQIGGRRSARKRAVRKHSVGS